MSPVILKTKGLSSGRSGAAIASARSALANGDSGTRSALARLVLPAGSVQTALSGFLQEANDLLFRKLLSLHLSVPSLGSDFSSNWRKKRESRHLGCLVQTVGDSEACCISSESFGNCDPGMLTFADRFMQLFE